jgi:phosphoribosylformimino-5-aminoimidazole carboxamide ribotide isomerase
MELIPAIDLLEGRVVRLRKGRYDEVTEYSRDPADRARCFRDQGARRLHVVDLDGARSGVPRNVDAIRAILGAASLSVEVGGGIRDEESARRWFDAGVERVVLGTAAAKNPELVRTLCELHPGGIVVAVDATADGEVAVEGWLERSGRSHLELAEQADRWGAAAILFTVIDRDGTREGPDVEATLALQRGVRTEVIASGGIGSLDHIRALSSAGIRSAICGRALYGGAFTLREALDAARTG